MHGNYIRNCLNRYSAYYIILLSAAAVECQIKKTKNAHRRFH